MFIYKLKYLFFIAFIILMHSESEARPEYAVRHNVVNCTACHISPTGGGIRNKYGKMYGSWGMGPGKYSLQDQFQADFRALYLQPEDKDNSRNGLGLMTAIGSANIPFWGDPAKSHARMVIGYNFGLFQPSSRQPNLREAYTRWQFGQDGSQKLLKHITVGRFNAPFGLLTDEHRTYTRIQARTTLNDYHMGAMFSGEPIQQLHYDLAVTNGFNNQPIEGGGALSQGSTHGSFANLRWGPSFLPFFVGVSGSHHRRPDGDDPWAYSTYLSFSLDRLTGGAFKGGILAERVRAKYWNNTAYNPGLGKRFVNSEPETFLNSILKEESEGFYAQFHWDITTKWTLLYKYDRLAFSKDFTSDALERHGIGFRHRPTNNLNVIGRYEFAEVGREDFNKSNPFAQDVWWLLLHIWI